MQTDLGEESQARMRKTMIVTLAVSAAAASACGSNSPYANKPSPPQPVDMAVYIGDSHISVSPSAVGAGPVVFTVTNQSSNSESLKILRTGATGDPLANTGPINPQGTAQVTVSFSSQGDYTLSTSNGTTDASLAAKAPIQPATIHIGPARGHATQQLLQP